MVLIIKFTVMKKDVLKIALLLSVLIGVNIPIISTDSKYHYTKLPNGNITSDLTVNQDWEFIKERLFSGEGEEEYVYKLNQSRWDTPILINLQNATPNDSLVIDEIIKELRIIIPNKTIDYFESYSGKPYDEFNSLVSKEEVLINEHSFDDLRFSTIKLNFGTGNNASVLDDVIKTVLPDGSRIERTNPSRGYIYRKFPSKVWFHLKDNLPLEKRRKYIKYELLRTLCFIYPNNSQSRIVNPKKGVFYSPNYIPDLAEFNDKDKFLLKKLYQDDFLKQFKSYLTETYSWRYTYNFLNKDLTQVIAWGIIVFFGLLVFLLIFSLFYNRNFKFSYLNYFFPTLFLIEYGINFLCLYQYLTNKKNPYIEVLSDYFVSLLLSVIPVIIFSLILWLLDKLWLNKIKSFSVQLLSKVIFTFIVFNLPNLLIVQPGSRDFLESYMSILIITVIISVARGLLIYLSHFSDSLVKEKEVELSRLKEVNAQSELKLLQSHINPHFLYNALNSIAGLTYSNPEKTEKMAISLSNLFRYSINKKGQKMSSIKEEVLMVENYLEIEKIRFGERLKFTLKVNQDIEEEQIPMFILQPLVENAIKHGVSEIREEGFITLEIKKESDNLFISVSDNGPDFPNGLVSGHGLQTVYDLLRLSYGNNAFLKWENTPVKQISILITKDQDNE